MANASVIDALMITIGIDTKGVKSGMAQAENTVAQSAKKLMNNVLKPLAAAFALGSAFQDYMSNALSLGKLSDSLGVSAGEIDAWGAAVENAGGSAEGLQGTLTSLNSKMLEFSNTGTSSAAPALAQLGISARNASGGVKSSMDILKELSSAADRIDPKRFQALAGSLGIDEGTILLLKQGSKNLDEVLERQRRLGVYTKEDTEIAAKMKAAFNDLMRVFRSISAVIMRLLLPPLTWLTNKLTDLVLFVKEHEVFIKGVIVGIATVLTAVLLPAIINIGRAGGAGRDRINCFYFHLLLIFGICHIKQSAVPVL
ncbi:MAG: phage tail tape measure protein [Mucispirillum sp.]|nr:phage tail tape measure protein [Mucispirillum sp.]